MTCTSGCLCGRHGRTKMSPDEARERHRQNQARFIARHPERNADAHLRRKFGITFADRAERLEAQGGGCAICGATEPGGKGQFHVDHDHACCPGKTSCGECIRGLLCTRCNVGIAMFQDDAARMTSAITYLGGI